MTKEIAIVIMVALFYYDSDFKLIGYNKTVNICVANYEYL